MIIKRNPNPFTFNYGCVVVLDRLGGTIFELDGEMAILYQLLGDNYITEEELSRRYEEMFGNPFNPAHLENLRSQKGLIDVTFT